MSVASVSVYIKLEGDTYFSHCICFLTIRSMHQFKTKAHCELCWPRLSMRMSIFIEMDHTISGWTGKDKLFSSSSSRSDRRRHRIRWHSFVKSHRPSLTSQSLQLWCMSAGQLMVLRKLSLLKVTANMERHCPSNRSGWIWYVETIPHTAPPTGLGGTGT